MTVLSSTTSTTLDDVPLSTPGPASAVYGKSIAESSVFDWKIGNGLGNRCDASLQLVAFGAAHAHGIALNGSLNLRASNPLST